MSRAGRWAVGTALLAAALTGCGQFDEVYEVRMINDTGQPISIGLCADDHCSQTDWQEGMTPGATLPANANSETPTTFVAYLAGARRCLAVNLTSQPTVTYAVSRFSAC